ncbi:MAG TPA: flavin reductase family protein [Fimbriimonadaceae bacterium]|nr:flavin reductase family protein [Fimbriimonadaceae bacterium]
MRTFASLDPQELAPRKIYEVLVGCIQPRPIAFVSTVSRDGKPNLAPFSFFVAGGASPASLVYSASLNARGEPKDSLRNVEETREFVVNIVTRAMAEGMNATSPEFGPEFDEWSVSGFRPLASDCVRPARVAESPAQFECRLFQVLRHGDGPSAAAYVVGEVVRIHVAHEAWDGQSLLLDQVRPIARLGGSEYLDTASGEIFTMPRPSASAERRSVED